MCGKQQAVRSDAGVVRFAWLSDTHLSAQADLEPYRRRFAEAIAGARAARPDFTLVTGDLVDKANAESYELFRRGVADLPGPVFCVPGNHDVGEKRFEAAPPGSVVTSERMAAYRAASGLAWQRFSVQGRHFLLLTSSLFGSGLPDERQQWEWLERELASPADVDELSANVSTPEKAAQVYAAARIAIDPDTMQEREFLRQLAEALDLDQAMKAQIDETAGSGA